MRLIAIYGALAMVLLSYVIWQIVRRDGDYSQLLDGWGVAAFEILASGLCIARSVTTRKARATTLALGLGLLSWAIGDAVLAAETAGGATAPSPSLADAFYLGFYPLTYVALMLMVRRQVKAFGVVTWLDGGIAGIGAAAVCATFAFHNVMRTAGLTPLATATNLAYPIGDVLLLTLVVGASAVLPGRRRAPWLMLATGISVNTVGDTFNLFSSSIGSTHVGNVFNAIAWPTSVLLISASVWLRPAASTRLGRENPPSFVLPGAAAAAALVILIVGSLHHIGHVALGLAIATLVAAGVRFALSLASLRTLTENRRRQAVTDQLTGLGNRRALFQQLDDFFGDQDEQEVPPGLAFMFVDLNGFKEVNDSFGHSAGDELLRQLGTRLKGSLRASDLFVRLGGDEFAVALIDADADYAATVATRLSARLEEPFVLDAVRATISASIGIAVAPTDANNPADLVRCADLAMYRAKVGGKCFAIYQEDLDGIGDRMRLVEELRTAIEQRELELHYQPQVELPSGQIVAVEALMRWRHPRLGFIPPLEFLPLAEEAGLMAEITRLALEKALAQCAQWRAGGESVTVSVNISATSLLDRDFPSLVEQLLSRYGLTPGALVLELTETTAIADFERSKETIERLRDVGVIVSVDDFGAGVTSLAYLSSLAVGELKLDRSFITELASTDPRRATVLIRSTIELAHSLGLRVVAEGVEDAGALGVLTGLGCDLAQGYLISKPKPADELALQRATPEGASVPAMHNGLLPLLGPGSAPASA